MMMIIIIIIIIIITIIIIIIIIMTLFTVAIFGYLPSFPTLRDNKILVNFFF